MGYFEPTLKHIGKPTFITFEIWYRLMLIGNMRGSLGQREVGKSDDMVHMEQEDDDDLDGLKMKGCGVYFCFEGNKSILLGIGF